MMKKIGELNAMSIRTGDVVSYSGVPAAVTHQEFMADGMVRIEFETVCGAKGEAIKNPVSKVSIYQ